MNDSPSIPLKRCIKCKQEFPATTQWFTHHARRKDGLVEQCRTCANITRRALKLRPRDIIPDGHKRCSRCKQVKPATLEFFAASPRHRYGVGCACKECRNVEQRQTYVSRRPVSDIPDGYKRCTKCSEVKPLTKDFFYATKPQRGASWYPTCKECANREKKGRYARKKLLPSIPYDAKNRKKCSQCKEVKPCTMEYFSRHVASRDGLVSVCRVCKRIRTRALQVKKRDHILAVRRRYRATHSDLIKAIHRNRYAHRRGAQGKHSQSDIVRQYRAQKGKCYYCRKPLTTYHVDHIIPLSRGGSNDPSNLVVACPHCNTSKNNKMPHEWPEGGRLM